MAALAGRGMQIIVRAGQGTGARRSRKQRHEAISRARGRHREDAAAAADVTQRGRRPLNSGAGRARSGIPRGRLAGRAPSPRGPSRPSIEITGPRRSPLQFPAYYARTAAN